MISPIDERILPLLGEEGLMKIHAGKVVVFGLGGVGGTCYEALLRSGVSSLIGVDFDNVEESNLNRQMLFEYKDIGKSKSEVAFRRAYSIRPDSQVKTLNLKIDSSSLKRPEFLDADIWVDAVDDLSAKVALIEAASSSGKPLFVSLGMGNRLDPSAVYQTTLDKTSGDPLAKKLRKILREKGIKLKDVRVVASKELPLIRRFTPSSMMMVPSAAGLLLAYLAISELLK